MSKRLGKGLDALIPSFHVNEDDKVIEIPLSQLRANPYQPRKTFDEDALKNLRNRLKNMVLFNRLLFVLFLKVMKLLQGNDVFVLLKFAAMQRFLLLLETFLINRLWKLH